MSASNIPLKVVKVVEPTLDIRDEKVFAVFKGGSDNTFYNYPSSSYSNSLVSWNINTPSDSLVFDRKFKIKCKLRFTFAIDPLNDQGKLLIQSGRDALRSFPLAKAMSSLTLQLNNTSSITVNMSDVIKGMERLMNESDFHQEYTTTPCYPDQGQTYSEYDGFMKNPLNGIGDSVYGAVEPRGAFPVEIISLTNTECVLDYTITEPLFISPLHFTRTQAEGFVGIRNINVVIQWKNQLINSLWSRNEQDVQFETASVEFVGALELLIRAITPSELMSTDIPRESIYGYQNIISNVSTFAPLAPGQTATSSNNALQLSVIPRRLILFVSRDPSEEKYYRTDSFFGIENISILMGNKSGILSSATQEDLYKIAIKNGSNQTWREFSGKTSSMIVGNQNIFSGVGSVLPLMIPEDITLSNSDILSSGVADKLNLQIQIRYKNLHPTETITPRFTIIVDTSGVFGIDNGMSFNRIGVLTEEDVLNAQFHPNITYSSVQDLYGGDFFADVKSVIKKVPGAIVKGAKFAKDDLLPIAQAVMSVLPMLGLGVKKTRGGLLVGGSKVSRAELTKKLMEVM